MALLRAKFGNGYLVTETGRCCGAGSAMGRTSMFHAVWSRISPLAWLFPGFVMAIGAVFPSLRLPVRLEIPPLQVTPGMLVQVLLSSLWMLAEYRFAASRDTTIKQLQADLFRSISLSMVLCFVAGLLLAREICPWFYLIPMLSSVGDAFLTTNQGLNNAAQKPFVPMKH